MTGRSMMYWLLQEPAGTVASGTLESDSYTERYLLHEAVPELLMPPSSTTQRTCQQSGWSSHLAMNLCEAVARSAEF